MLQFNKQKELLDRQKTFPLILWVGFFCFSVCAALTFQKLLVPLVSTYSAGGGLLAHDSVYFNSVAISLADNINLYGWESWQLYPAPGTSANVAILAALYVLFGHDPALMIPINAILHASGGLLVYLISIEVSTNKRLGVYAGVVASSLFVIFPSALNWYGQIHKDGFAIAGTLLILLTWLKALRCDRGEVNFWSNLGFYSIGVFLIAIVRPYNLKIVFVATLLALLIILLISLVRFRLIKKIKLLMFYLLATFILVAGMKFTTLLAESSSNVGMGDAYASWDTKGKWAWQNSTWLPDGIEAYIQLASKTRAGLIYNGLEAKAKSIIDKEIKPQNIFEVVLHLPRALQVGLFAPFPNTWFDDLTLPRLVAVGEMTVYYLCSIGIVLLLLFDRKPAAYVAVYFATFFLTFFGFTLANVGTLYRLRYSYEFILILLGVLGWLIYLNKIGLLRFLRNRLRRPAEVLGTEKINLQNETTKRKEVIVTGSIVMALTLVCFIAFFIRDIMMARVFGLSEAMDSFFIALLIPMFFVTVFSLPLGAAFMPTYIYSRENYSNVNLRSMVSNVSFLSTALLFFMCLILYLFGSSLLDLIHIDDVSLSDSKLLPLMNVALLILLFSGVVILGNTVLSANGRAVISSIAQLIVPIVAIITLSLFGSTYGVMAVMLGMVVGQLLNLSIIQYYLRSCGVSLMPKFQSIFGTEVSSICNNYFPLASSAFFIAFAAPVSTFLAMTLPSGSVSAFNLGSKVVLFITGLVSTTVTAVMLPYFSTLIVKKHIMSARRELSFFLLLATFISIPISSMLFLWAEKIVSLLFIGGAFDSRAVSQVVTVMQYSVIQLPFFICNAILLKFSTATNHVKSILLIAFLGLVLNIGGSIFLMEYMGVGGVALGSSISVVFSTIFLVLILVRFWHISRFDALMMLLNWMLFLTLLMSLHFKSLTSVYAIVLAYATLVFAYLKSLKFNGLSINWWKF